MQAHQLDPDPETYTEREDRLRVKRESAMEDARFWAKFVTESWEQMCGGTIPVEPHVDEAGDPYLVVLGVRVDDTLLSARSMAETVAQKKAGTYPAPWHHDSSAVIGYLLHVQERDYTGDFEGFRRFAEWVRRNPDAYAADYLRYLSEAE